MLESSDPRRRGVPPPPLPVGQVTETPASSARTGLDEGWGRGFRVRSFRFTFSPLHRTHVLCDARQGLKTVSVPYSAKSGINTPFPQAAMRGGCSVSGSLLGPCVVSCARPFAGRCI